MIKSGKTLMICAALSVAQSGFSGAIHVGVDAPGWKVDRSVGPSPRPWLRQKKGRGAQ